MAISSYRRLLHSTITTPNYAAGNSSLFSATGDSSSPTIFDAKDIMILAVLLTALLCALSFNVIVRCILRLTNHSSPNTPTAFHGAAFRRRAIRKFPVMLYSPDLKLIGSGSECAICLAEIELGERNRLLPDCRHGFHMHCIDRWLLTRHTCPSCRQSLFGTSPNSSGLGEPEEVDRRHCAAGARRIRNMLQIIAEVQ